jgi:hypothetical protein
VSPLGWPERSEYHPKKKQKKAKKKTINPISRAPEIEAQLVRHGVRRRCKIQEIPSVVKKIHPKGLFAGENL